MFSKLPSGKPADSSQSLRKVPLLSDLIPSVLTIFPYLLGIFLVQIPITKFEFQDYLQKFFIFILFILTLNLVKLLINRLKINQDRNKEDKYYNLKEWGKRFIILITGLLILFISSFLKYRFNYSTHTFQLSIVVLTCFFSAEGFKLKNQNLWSIFFAFIYLTSVGVLSVFVLIERFVPASIIFSSSIAGFLTSFKLFEYCFKKKTLGSNFIELRSLNFKKFKFLENLSTERIALTFLFFGYILTGLAGLLEILPKRFIFICFVSFPFYKYFEKRFLEVVQSINGNTTLNSALVGNFKRDGEYFAFLYCLIVMMLSF